MGTKKEYKWKEVRNRILRHVSLKEATPSLLRCVMTDGASARFSC